MKKTTLSSDDVGSVLPLIKKKYMWVIVLTIIVMAFLPSFFTGLMLYIGYVLLAIFLLINGMMYHNMYCFQKIKFSCRPFVVTNWILQSSYVLVGLLAVASIYMYILQGGDIIPYIVFWVIIVMIPLQYRSMFTTAKEHKEADPTKCEFC